MDDGLSVLNIFLYIPHWTSNLDALNLKVDVIELGKEFSDSFWGI